MPNRLEAFKNNPTFFRINFRRMITASFVLSAFILILLGFIAYQFYSLPTPHYFAATTDGRLIEIQPLK